MATIIQIINADRNLSLFCKALKASGLESKLNEIGPYTILGPVNLAMNKLSPVPFEQLLEPANKNTLLNFLSRYILVGKKMWSDFRNNQQVPTLEGKPITSTILNGDILINGSKILAHDRQGANGVVHLLGTTYSDF
jgi:uncharacterized surface protein with fasciclin (FAS1) repeats